MTIWVLPEGSNDIGDATDGDLLVRAEGEELHVARLVGDAVEWLGGEPVDSIVLPDVDEPTPAPEELTEELEGYAAALATRGG